MKKRVFYKILVIIMVMFFAFNICSNDSYARMVEHYLETDAAGVSSGSSGDNFDLSGYETGTASEEITKPVNTIAGLIINVMRIICVSAAIIMLIMLALKYITSAPGERAEIKKSAVQFAVGAVVLFASSGILTIIEHFITNALPST